MTDGAGGMPDFNDMLAKVASNPQAMTMLASLLGGRKDGGTPPPPPSKADEPCDEKEEAKPVHFSPPALPSKPPDPRCSLLLALKPFLSPEKCRVIDTLLFLLEALDRMPGGKGG